MPTKRARRRDPYGSVGIRADDWTQVQFYRFGTSTAEFVAPSILEIGETALGARAVNTICREAGALFTSDPAQTDHDGETTESRLAGRAANWTSAASTADRLSRKFPGQPPARAPAAGQARSEGGMSGITVG